MLASLILLAVVLVIAAGAGVWTNQGVSKEGDLVAPIAAKVHLYTSATTPTVTSVPGDFTEATFPGYAPISLPTGAGGFASGGSVTITWGAVLSWIVTGANSESVTGYYITDISGSTLYAAELLGSPAPYDMSAIGTTLALTVVETLTAV